MPLPVISDVYRVALNWTHSGGQRAVNVIHIRRAGSNSAAVASALDSNAASAMWTDMSSGAVMQRLDVTPLDGASATYQLATSGAKWTGTTAGDFLPAAAGLVSLRTGLRGRANRGRIYRPFITETSNSNGVLGSGGVAAAQTAWNTWLTAMNAAGFIPVVASYVHVYRQDITSVLVEATLGTQRRRQTRLR